MLVRSKEADNNASKPAQNDAKNSGILSQKAW